MSADVAPTATPPGARTAAAPRAQRRTRLLGTLLTALGVLMAVAGIATWGGIAQGLAQEPDGARLMRQGAHERAQQGRLPGAVGAHDGDDLAGGDGEGHLRQDRGAVDRDAHVPGADGLGHAQPSPVRRAARLASMASR